MNNLDISQPDPTWDYYVTWHSLHHIKAKLDAALKFIQEKEHATPITDKQLRELLDPVSDKLIELVEDLPEEDNA